jgi:hypothetical protein
MLIANDLVTDQPFFYDQFDDYADPDVDVSEISVAVLGDVGQGKSTLLKDPFCMQQIIRGRYVVVLDKKLQGTEGEYAKIARLLGTQPVRFVASGGAGGSRINLLDKAIAVGADDADDAASQPVSQMRLIRAVLNRTIDPQLSEHEGKAVRVALADAHDLADRDGRVALVKDLVHALLHPSAAAAERSASTTGELREWGRRPGFALERLIEEDLAGLVDGETSPEVTLDHPARLTVFDVSALPEDGPALPIVMLLIQTWMANLLRQRVRRLQQTVMIVEEGWHVTEGEMGRMFRSNIKLQRGTGLSTVVGFHHPSDSPPDSPARALLREPGALFVFGQKRPEDVDETIRLGGLDPAMREIMLTLRQGQCLLVRKGREPVALQIVRSALTVAMTETDEQVTGIASRGLA